MRKLKKIGKVHYYVSEKDKVVQGFLESRESPFGWMMSIPGLKRAERFAIRDLSRMNGSEADFRRKMFSAKATCSESDKFDVNVGKEIVNLKLKLQWYGLMIARLMRIGDNALNIWYAVRETALKYAADYDVLYDEIKKYYGGED